MNRTAHRYIGHFDIPLKNRTASLRDRAAHTLHDDTTDYGAWVNLDNYAQTNEPFGLLPFDDQMRKRVSMFPFDNAHSGQDLDPMTLASPQAGPRIRHQFLSSMQGTRFAVLPVHTREERTLFLSLTNSSPLFTNTKQPDFVAIASVFNRDANGINIFYKASSLHRIAHFTPGSTVTDSLYYSLLATRTYQGSLQDMARLRQREGLPLAQH